MSHLSCLSILIKYLPIFMLCFFGQNYIFKQTILILKLINLTTLQKCFKKWPFFKRVQNLTILLKKTLYQYVMILIDFQFMCNFCSQFVTKKVTYHHHDSSFFFLIYVLNQDQIQGFYLISNPAFIENIHRGFGKDEQKKIKILKLGLNGDQSFS